jgi:hypothetical protein
MTGVYDAIDEAHGDQPAHTRRQMVAGAAAAFGSMGVFGMLPDIAAAGGGSSGNTPENILTVAATAEVLATIVNTVGAERVDLDGTTQRNVEAAAREELIHYQVLTKALGARPVTKRIWVPDAVFSSAENFLGTLVVGDQLFVTAYLIGTTTFGDAGNGKFARVAAEFMGVEGVHRALALQSLGRLGNDRVFMKYQFTNINTAVARLQAAGFGFGKKGKGPGKFYEFDRVSRRTPNPNGLNTKLPR